MKYNPSILLLAILLLGCSSEKEIKNGALSFARLADYPKSATEFRAETAGSPFTRQFFVSFKVDADGADNWIRESESIKNTKPKVFTEKQQYLPYPEGPDVNAQEIYNSGNHYYYPAKHYPSWVRDIRVKNGKLYKIPPDGEGHGWGWVILDYDTNTVYINVSWS